MYVKPQICTASFSFVSHCFALVIVIVLKLLKLKQRILSNELLNSVY